MAGARVDTTNNTTDWTKKKQSHASLVHDTGQANGYPSKRHAILPTGRERAHRGDAADGRPRREQAAREYGYGAQKLNTKLNVNQAHQNKRSTANTNSASAHQRI